MKIKDAGPLLTTGKTQGHSHTYRIGDKTTSADKVEDTLYKAHTIVPFAKKTEEIQGHTHTLGGGSASRNSKDSKDKEETKDWKYQSSNVSSM